MEARDGRIEVVDPQVRAYVDNLVSAIGGTGGNEDGRYTLGDDALACLKDLKRWLKLYDEKTDRLDVARCLAEANVVRGDLLEILAAWPEDATDERVWGKIALACLELLVPLTWPIEKTDQQITKNHHRHMPYLQLAQVGYKRDIIDHDTTQILRTIVRIGLPSMAEPMSDRSSRDEGIIKLVLYFLRNVALITPADNLHYEGNEEEVSRSATVKAFQEQDIFHLLLTVGSAMGEDFNTQDVILLEVLFHLVKGVDMEKLFMDDSQVADSNTDDLKDLLIEERGMHRDYLRHAPSRHNRFGTMLWVKRDQERVSTVSGQFALMDEQRTLSRIDSSKKWKKPGRAKALPPTTGKHGYFDNTIPLTGAARKQLGQFVNDFLDASFNPLFTHVRKAIERDADRVLEGHRTVFFYLIAWFLEAHRARLQIRQETQKDYTPDPDTFALIASVLNQETFILLSLFLERALDNKEWQALNAGMRCFTQILLTVQAMEHSPFEEDQEIAENMQNRIFYEESTHDVIVRALRTYSNQGFGYLDAVTELAHVHLRMLEQYSKQNVDLQVRSKRRVRRKRKAEQQQQHDDVNLDDANDESEAEDMVEAQRVSRERRFDFTRFCAKFMDQNCVDTYIEFTKYFRELRPAQLKRAHRYLYRVAFKMERSVMLFRLDIIALLHKLVKGPEGLDPTISGYSEWSELARQLFKKLTRSLKERPELAVELLFSKTASTAFYLEHGHDKEVVKTAPRAAAELQVMASVDSGKHIGVAVSALIDQNKNDALTWLYGVLDSAISERLAWENEAEARRASMQESAQTNAETDPEGAEPSNSREKPPAIVIKPDSEARKLALFKDGHLRLLLSLIGCDRLDLTESPDDPWTIPGALDSEALKEARDAIKAAEFAPPSFDDGQSAADHIRRKPAPRPRAAFDDDEGGDVTGSEDEFLFPAGGPTMRPKSDALEELKRVRRSRNSNAKELTEEERAEKAAARKAKELEKRRKIKSDLFVHESDEEDDEARDHEFFRLEEERRRRQRLDVLTAGKKKGKLGRGKKRKSAASGESGDDGDDVVGSSPKRTRRSESEDEDELVMSGGSSVHARSDPVGLGESESEAEDTPLSSPQIELGLDEEDVSGSASKKDGASVQEMDLDDGGEAEDDVVAAKQPQRRRRLANTFVLDSSDEE